MPYGCVTSPGCAPPSFITAPGETDVLMVVTGVILVLFVLMVGVLYFRLHALPDSFAHKKVQYEIVCVLGLIAMFTHMHIFWIAGLLLALVEFPDFSTPLQRIARSTEKLAGAKTGRRRRRNVIRDDVRQANGSDWTARP